MSYGIKLPTFFPAFAVSIVLHSVTLVSLNHTFFIRPKTTTSNLLPPVKIITVALISRPPQPVETQQSNLPVSSKPSGLPRPIVSISANKFKQPEHIQKSHLPAKAYAHNKFQKLQNPLIKLHNQNPEKKSVHLDGQSLALKPQLTHFENPSISIAESIAPTKAPPISEIKDQYSNATTINDKQLSSEPKLTMASLTKKPVSISSALPPLIKSRQPDYPEEARWEERTGKTLLKFKITDQGHVIEPQITKSSGHRDLDLAAIHAVKSWRFDYKENQASTQWFQYAFRFELN